MKIKAVVFDFDDCLIETFKHSSRELVDAAKRWNETRTPKLGMPSIAEVARHYYGEWYGWVGRLWPQLEGSMDDFRQLYIESAKEAAYPLIPGAEECLEYVSGEGYVIGMLTARSMTSLEFRMEALGIDKGVFHFICTAEEDGYKKPDSRAFEAVKKKLAGRGIEPEESLYVGDQVSDRGCENYGIKFVAVCTGIIPRSGFLDAGMDDEDILTSIAEFPAYLQSRQ